MENIFLCEQKQGNERKRAMKLMFALLCLAHRTSCGFFAATRDRIKLEGSYGVKTSFRGDRIDFAHVEKCSVFLNGKDPDRPVSRIPR